ncbi:exonuclease 1 [Platysternon megacephalum]|uniref:Dynein light chain Tctex-type 3 n=1 Tax=Platysternon megacephalum TaxID=55544 RepID=A0A4D9EPU0_9SAUR|nr:exonuclease 1 [Platysternon megacephalum]
MEEFHPHNDEVGRGALRGEPAPSTGAIARREGSGAGLERAAPGDQSAGRSPRGRGVGPPLAGVSVSRSRSAEPARPRGGTELCIRAGPAALRGVRCQMTFNAEEAHNIVKECIEGILGKVDYNHNKVNQWTATIVEQSLTHLVKLGKTYKYIVTCAVMQKCGAGLHTASSCFWDTTTDGTCTVRWENRTMNCIVNVFAIAVVL